MTKNKMNFQNLLLLNIITLLFIIHLIISNTAAISTLSVRSSSPISSKEKVNNIGSSSLFIDRNVGEQLEAERERRRLLLNDPIYGKLNSYFDEEERRALNFNVRYSSTVDGNFFSSDTIRKESNTASPTNVRFTSTTNNNENRRFSMEQAMVEELSNSQSSYNSAAVTATASIPTVYLLESLDEMSGNNTCTSVDSPCKNWTLAVDRVFSLCDAYTSKLSSKTVNNCEAKIELLSGVKSCQAIIPQLVLYKLKISIYSNSAQYRMKCGGDSLTFFGNLMTGVSDASNISLSFNNIQLINTVFIFSGFGEISFNGSRLNGVFFNSTTISRFTLSKSYATDVYLAQQFTKFAPISTDFLTIQQSTLEYCFFSITSRAIDIKSSSMTNIRMTYDALGRVVIRDSSYTDSAVLISSSDTLIGTGFAEFSFYIVNINFSRSSLIVSYYRNGRALVSAKLYVVGCNFYGKALSYQISVVDFTKISIDNCLFDGLNTYSEYSAVSLKSYYSKTEASVTSSSFFNYYSKSSGAGLNIYGIEIGYIADCIFRNNTALDNGGALTIDRVGLATVQYCTFIDNKFESKRESQFFSYGGGALFVYKSFIELTRNVFTNNTANGLGGAIIVNTACSIKTTNDVFDNNSALYGGAIAYTDYQLNDCSNVVFFTYNSTFINNKAKYFGGFFFARKLPIMYFDTLTSFRLNSAQLSGGGIYYLEKPSSKKVINGNPESLGFGNTGMYTKSNIESFPNRIEVYSKSSMESQSGVLTSMHLFLLDENNQTTPFFPGMMDLELQSSSLSFITTKFTFSNSSRTLKLDYTFYSKSAEFPFQSNLLLILRLKEFDIAQNFDFTATSCNIGYYVIRDEDNETLYKCSLTLTITLSATIAGILLLCIGFLVGFFFLRMIRRITTIVMDYKKKELAEKELTEKLISYQVLFENGDVELDGYKQWMIPVRDLEIVSKIGEGSYGIVYKLWKANVEVAIKSIKVDEDSISSFEHEASLLSSCRHLNIVTFYGCTITGETNYLVEEYMSGGGLDKMLYRVGKGLINISLKQKLRILIDVSCGMSYLNELKPPIIHRDLKPENILLSREMVAKVSDFGLSTISNPQRTMTCQIGSLFYMAPELFNSNYYNEKCDVYSFSIVMWELFFGTRYSSFGSDANDRFKFLLTREQILELSTLATSSIAFVLKKVAEGTRLPLPNSTSSHLKWIRVFMPEHASNDEHCKVIVKVMEKYFTLMVECWDSDHTNRPDFRDIMYRLKEMVDMLYFDECVVRNL